MPAGRLRGYDAEMTDELPPESPIDTTTSHVEGLGYDQRVGPYRLLSVLGEGGMGTVYLAEQTEPIRRRVALKIIKVGMDTREVIARFEAERHALALMDHPHVARVLDAGATEIGRPYIVMEHVAGIPITAYADQNRLSTSERVRLFISVCLGVQHAHQKGIIHRDIKPSNILVTVQDGDPVPVVIDFGVAKAVDHRLTERTLFTEIGQLIGTPEYMSPEQAEMSALDVDTRTDIYSLGVSLYELLVGAPPFEPGALRRGSLSDIQRTIREENPVKPSSRLTTLGENLARVAERRRTDASSLSKAIRGDLDWITMKAMEKDRTRRYASAAALADDLNRFLANEPAVAGPPDTAYRLRKLIQRNRGPVAAVSGVVLALAIGLVVSTVLYVRSERERRRADMESEASKQVSGFLIDLFQVSDPGEARGNTVTAREILDRGTERIEGALGGQPVVRSALMGTMGRVYQGLGLYDPAERLLTDALTMRQSVYGPDALETAVGIRDLGVLLEKQGEYARAESLLSDALRIRRAHLPANDSAVATSIDDMGEVRMLQGDFKTAETVHREALTMREAVLGAGHPDIATSLNNLGSTLLSGSQAADAEPMFRRALSIRRQALGDDAPLTLQSINNLAVALFNQGRFDEAEPLYREALARRRQLLGEVHPDVASTSNNLATLLLKKGAFMAAESLYFQALDIQRQLLGPNHPNNVVVLGNLGLVCSSRGDHEAAIRYYRDGIEAGLQSLPKGHLYVAALRGGLGESLRQLKRFPEAATELETALQAMIVAAGVKSERTAKILKSCIALYDEWGRTADAKRCRDLLSQAP